MRYYLAEACGNTFVLFDCLEHSTLSREFLQKAHQILVQEKRDDALILLNGQRTETAFFVRMVVLGLDGALGEFCGNGARACGAYLFYKYPLIHNFYINDKYPITQKGKDIYSIKLSAPSFDLNEKFIKSSFSNFHYIEILEPHLIINKMLSDDDLISIGRELNAQKWCFPLGINLNAWHVMHDGSIFVKTYERGVQRLTKSCGTGSIACAAFFKKKGKVHVITPGGPLEVTIEKTTIELKGPASFDKEKREKWDLL